MCVQGESCHLFGKGGGGRGNGINMSYYTLVIVCLISSLVVCCQNSVGNPVRAAVAVISFNRPHAYRIPETHRQPLTFSVHTKQNKTCERTRLPSFCRPKQN